MTLLTEANIEQRKSFAAWYRIDKSRAFGKSENFEHMNGLSNFKSEKSLIVPNFCSIKKHIILVISLSLSLGTNSKNVFKYI